MSVDIMLTLPTIAIIKKLRTAGFTAHIVGGAVRDLLLKASSENGGNGLPLFTDIDFTTNATPEQIKELFPDSFYENTFGTVSVPFIDMAKSLGFEENDVWENLATTSKPSHSNRLIDMASATKIHTSLLPPSETQTLTTHTKYPLPNFEITTYRSESAYQDHRRPSEVQWGSSLEQDLERRDFTINAMAITLDDSFLESVHLTVTDISALFSPVVVQPAQYQVVDPHHGLDDLKLQTIRTVGDPTTRFKEDALRMLRAIRFSVQLNMQIEDATFEAIISHAQDIHHISWERIRDEMMKMLKSEFPAEGIELLDESGLLEYILPELQATKGIMQGGHHTTDVWTHSLDALRHCPSSDPIVRLATLLHDIAKPDTYKLIEGTITFYNHEIIGSRIASKIAKRLRLSRKDCDRIFTLVREHMFYYQPQNTDASIRRFMRKVGLENIDDILDLREGDRLGSGARRTSWRLEEMKERMIEQLNQPLDVTDLAIDGHDLMTELKMKPGPGMGKVLTTLFEKVMDNPELNTKEALLAEAKALVATL